LISLQLSQRALRMFFPGIASSIVNGFGKVFGVQYLPAIFVTNSLSPALIDNWKPFPL